MTCTLDFPHAALWCAACYAESQTNALIRETRRANDLKEEELAILRENQAGPPSEVRWGNRPVAPPRRPVYLPPPPAPKAPAPTTGGMTVEPRRRVPEQ